MEYKRNIIILGIIICILFGVSGAWAGDVNDTAVADAQDITDELTQTEVTDSTDAEAEMPEPDMKSAGDDTLISDSTDSENTFETIGNEISKASAGSTLHLNATTYKGSGNWIGIDKSITIEGHGAVLDAQGQSRMFYVNASDVTIKNITFINGHDEGDGGAIYWNGADGKVSDCSFMNCAAEVGGAILWSRSNGANGVVSDCSFINNTANGNKSLTHNGGAIVWGGSNGKVSDCNFVNNTALNTGGAILWDAINGNISNCSFVNCSAAVEGGAIYLRLRDINCSVSGCSFVNNHAEFHGGAIQWDNHKGSVSDCSFVNNHAENQGGAIQWDCAGDSSVVNCIFVNNTVDEMGGAIAWIVTDNGTVSGCTFIGNAAYGDGEGGGAIYWDRGSSNGKVSDCIFVNNSAWKSSGGAINWHGDRGSVSNCSFINNQVGPFGKGNAVTWMMGEDGSLSNSNFKYCDVTTTDEDLCLTLTLQATLNYNRDIDDSLYGLDKDNLSFWNGTAYETHDGIPTYGDVKFVGQTVTLEIYDSKGKQVDKHSDKTNSDGQIVYDYSKLANGAYTYNVRIDDKFDIFTGSWNVNISDFYRLQTLIDDTPANSTIYLNATTYKGPGCINIYKPITIDGNGAVLDAQGQSRMFYVNASDVTIKNITFINGYDGYIGGAIYWNSGSSNGKVSDCNFVNNTANYSGGAIVWGGSNGKVSDCNFVNNTAVDAAGGAIRWGEGINDGSVSGCSFVNNNAHTGGAIKWGAGSDNGNVSDCSFVNNSAELGGAIHWSSSYDGSVSGCSFVNNYASEHMGGAIYWADATYNGDISNCSFMYNSANKWGGAIYWGHICNNGKVSSCIFVGNAAYGGGEGGGAIYWDGDEGKVSDCIFVNNSAYRSGGAINWHGKRCSVSNCSFINNQAGVFSKGNAVTWSAEDGSLSNSNFKYCDLTAVDEDLCLTLTLQGTLNYNDDIGDAKYGLDKNNLSFWNGTAYETCDGIPTYGDVKFVGQTVTLEIYDSKGKQVDKLSGKTNADGQIVYDYSRLANGGYTYNVRIDEKFDIFAGSLNIGGFNQLQSIIDRAPANSTIILTRNFTYAIGIDNITEGIVIDKSLTINGNGAVLDAQGFARIFNITSGDVVIKNIIFINGKVSGYGGAIYCDGANCTVSDCSFKNNTASVKGGGAIRWLGNSGSIVNSTFTDNSADYCGGAIDWGAPGATVVGCSFTNNTAPAEGGALYLWDDDCSVSNSSFKDNAAARGGAIYWHGNSGKLENSNFTDNHANENGGSVVVYGTGFDLDSCSFTNNTANTTGGALYLTDTSSDINIKDSEFKDNAAAKGDAISSDKTENRNITGNKFYGNSTNALYSPEGKLNSSNSKFLNEAIFTTNVISDFVNGSSIEINVSETKNKNFNGRVDVVIGENVYPLDIINGSGRLVVTPNLKPGNYVVEVVFNETDEFYSNGFESNPFHIRAKPEISIANIGNVDEGTPVTIKVTAAESFNGDFIIVIDGANYTVSMVNGSGEKTLTLSPGTYNATIRFTGNDYYTADDALSNVFIVRKNINGIRIALSKSAFTYNAKVQKPTVTLSNGLILKEGIDYTLIWSTASPKKAGTYTIRVTGIGAYTGTTKVTFKINKAANPLKVKAKTVKVKFSKLKKKAQKLKVTKVVKFTKKGQGTLTYKKVKGNKKITVNKKTGKVTIKKGIKKGTYKVKVKIKANGNANYKASAFKTITFKIKVK